MAQKQNTFLRASAEYYPLTVHQVTNELEDIITAS
jgi:hypothetical protein